MKDNWRLLVVVLAALYIGGCGGDDEGGGVGQVQQSHVEVTIDGMDATTTGQTSGVNAVGNSSVVISGANWSLAIGFPGASTGDFSSTAAGGATVTYTDANQVDFVADDTTASSSYEIRITKHTADGLDGTVTASVSDGAGGSHEVTVDFKLVYSPTSSSNPYGGTYMGIFSASGQIRTGTDPDTNEPIWGPKQTLTIRVTVGLKLLANASGIAGYVVESVLASDPLFGCTATCPLETDLTNAGAMVSLAPLPSMPGTPTPNGASQAGMGFAIRFPNGSFLGTLNGEGELYTSTDGRTMSNAVQVDPSWIGSDTGGLGVIDARFGDGGFGASYDSLNPDTRNSEWTLTRSAL